MTEAIRTKLETGDRVYVVNDEGWSDRMRVGEIRTVLHAQEDRDWINVMGGPHGVRSERFLRIIEPGEVIPEGAVTRVVSTGGLEEEYEHVCGLDWTHEAPHSLRVLVSTSGDRTTSCRQYETRSGGGHRLSQANS